MSQKELKMRDDPGVGPRVGYFDAPQCGPSGWEIADTLLRVSNLAQSSGYAHGLKPSQWTALRYFAKAPAAKRTVSAFAAFHATTRGAASQMVDILVAKGLAVRVPVPEDRRVSLLQLTAKAHALLDKDPLSAFVRVIDTLRQEQRNALADSLEHLADALHGDEPP